ncbi:MAG: phage tail protein [Crocinitomicaceae bacterium]|nr:phage tail protein [Crocinitomicaceae bacterium]
MDDIIGMIKLFSGTFAPQNWALCDGSLLLIKQYSNLFAVLGTQYGGDGTITFALPDLRGRAALGSGQGPGLSNYVAGEQGGFNTITLIQLHLPVHNHTFSVSSANATQSAPNQQGNTIGTPCHGTGRSVAQTNGFNLLAPDTQLSSQSLMPAGSDQPHDNMQPYLGMYYIICMQGTFPQLP